MFVLSRLIIIGNTGNNVFTKRRGGLTHQHASELAANDPIGHEDVGRGLVVLQLQASHVVISQLD